MNDPLIAIEEDIAWLISEVKRLRAQLDRAKKIVLESDVCPPLCPCEDPEKCEEMMLKYIMEGD